MQWTQGGKGSEKGRAGEVTGGPKWDPEAGRISIGMVGSPSALR